MRTRHYYLGCLILAFQFSAYAQDETSSSEFSSCAAYYFLNSHVSRLSDYERLYQLGERALNQAVILSDRKTAQANFDRASNDMMELMNHDWLNFSRVEARFGPACEGLLNPDIAPRIVDDR